MLLEAVSDLFKPQSLDALSVSSVINKFFSSVDSVILMLRVRNSKYSALLITQSKVK